MKLKPKNSERKKIPVLSHVIIFCLIGKPCTCQNKIKTNGRASLLASYPGKAFPTLCQSEPRRPTGVKPGAHRGRRSPARQCCCSDFVALCGFQHDPKNKHRLNLTLQSRTTLTYSYMLMELSRRRPDRAHSRFPRVSRYTRRLDTKAATALLSAPPLPASTR